MQDPAVDNLSSFIGVDGTNTTLNSGRILINLKPVAVRKISASDVIRRLQPELAKVPGTTLYMQPVQDLSVEDVVSRTQFQYTLEDPNVDELNVYAPQMLAKMQQLPQLSDVASDQQTLGLGAKLVFDRKTASRLGITTSAIDQTLYDAYGQREVSTMFTQLNQYHVVLEVKPSFGKNPAGLDSLFIQAGAVVPTSLDSIHLGVSEYRPDPIQRLLACGDDHGSHYGEPSGSVSGGYAIFQPCAERILGRCRQGREPGES